MWLPFSSGYVCFGHDVLQLFVLIRVERISVETWEVWMVDGRWGVEPSYYRPCAIGLLYGCFGVARERYLMKWVFAFLLWGHGRDGFRIEGSSKQEPSRLRVDRKSVV